jgi:SAM-dependent methyltransferase
VTQAGAPRSAAEGDPAWIAEHRAVWRRKPGLRAVYRRYFRRLRAACVPGWPIVEIGSGPGFLKEFYPDIVSTDVAPSAYADRVIDATAMPFAPSEVGTFVLIDVFHHLPRPDLFLQEVARVLKPHGRLVMIEPWMGLAGWLFHRFVHHEDCDLRVRPEAPWGEGSKDPMAGNAALPYLYFRPGGQLERMPLPLRVTRREPFAALPWLLSGGFQKIGLLPEGLVGVVERADGVLSLLPGLTALRCFLVVERIESSAG